MSDTIDNLKDKEIKGVAELYTELAPYGDYCLTKKGSLIGAIALTGRDSDGLIEEDFVGLSLLASSFYKDLSSKVIRTQYYAHFDGAKITLKERDNRVSEMLSQRRVKFINSKRLSSHSLVHYFEVLPDESLSKLNAFDLLSHIGKSFVNKDSKEIVRRHFSEKQSVVCFLAELEKQKNMLDDIIADVCSRWEGLFKPVQLSIDDMWAHMKFIANLDPYYLTDDYKGVAPDSSWDICLPDADRSLKFTREMTVMKLDSVPPQYVRSFAVNKFGGKKVKWGLWGDGKGSPVRLPGNYLLMFRSQNLSRAQQSMLFTSKERELGRKQISVGALVKQDQRTESEKQAAMKPAIRQAIEELGEAENLDEVYCKSHSFITVWDTDPKLLSNQCIAVKRAADIAGLSGCWETAGMSRAFKTIIPGGRDFSLRDVELTSNQAGAASLFYAPAIGQPVVEDLNNEEAQYVFMSEDGSPFYYNPFVGGRGVVIGIGPIRSGKSFTKNTLASHWVKYGGSIHGIDIDPGMEPVALCYGEDGARFVLEDGQSFGFNPFAVCKGIDDTDFINHLKNQILLMIKSNDAEEMRSLDTNEQIKLDEAIVATIKLDKDLQRLSTVVQHCPSSLRQKLSRWVHTTDPSKEHGIYAKYFDQKNDAIGSLDKKVVAYNLRSIKDNPIVLPIVMAEIFYRVTRLFENPDYRHLPKYLDCDEAHALLKIPSVLAYLVRSVRTWGKWLGGIGLWTQSPKELKDLPDWPALLSASSTLFFMADPDMDVQLYKTTFQLSEGECQSIKKLRAKREAYIIQRDIGVSKKVILEVEPTQYVVSTSKPSDDVVRRRNYETYGPSEGVIRTAIELGLEKEEFVSQKEEVA